jgi:hypothetical protein
MEGQRYREREGETERRNIQKLLLRACLRVCPCTHVYAQKLHTHVCKHTHKHHNMNGSIIHTHKSTYIPTQNVQHAAIWSVSMGASPLQCHYIRRGCSWTVRFRNKPKAMGAFTWLAGYENHGVRELGEECWNQGERVVVYVFVFIMGLIVYVCDPIICVGRFYDRKQFV